MQNKISKKSATNPESEISWRLLSIVNLVRLLVASLLLVIFEFADSTTPWGHVHPDYFRIAVIALLIVSVLMSVGILQQKIKLNLLAFLGSIADSLLFAILMHSSGGFGDGLGVMLLLSLCSAALILPHQLVLFTASVAVITLLTQHVLTDFETSLELTDYTGAGLLGVLLFVSSMGVQRFGQRYRETEALAARRGVDIANLSKLNDYVLQRIRESIVVLDEQGYTRLMNKSAARLLGAHNPKSKYHLADLSPKLYRHWQESLENPYLKNDHSITLDGSSHLVPNFVPLGGNPADRGTLLFLEDHSNIQEQIQHSKLAALGRLSASIAHEIRNPLASISHANQLLGESDNLDKDDLYFTGVIDKQVKRVNQIIENVLGLTGAPLDQPDLVDLHVWLKSFANEFRATAELSPEQISFDFHLHRSQKPDHSSGLPEAKKKHSVPFGETQLRQVMSNLFENALDHSNTGKKDLRILCRTSLHPQSDRFMLEVCDNGSGIDAETADELFEPFHSGNANGSGLGLYIARELCSLNHASLAVENTPDGGACFRLLFADSERWR